MSETTSRREALGFLGRSAAQASAIAALPIAATVAARAFPAATAASEGIPMTRIPSVPTPGERLVTVEQMAAMDFKPWEHLEDGWRVPSNEEWMPFGIWVLPTVRIAWMTMFKTKAELETISRELDDDAFEAMVAGIGAARAAFEDFVKVLAGAETRIMCAAFSALAKDDPEGLADA